MITKLKLWTTLHWTIVVFFLHVNWCSAASKYLLIVLRMFIHYLILLFRINPFSFFFALLLSRVTRTSRSLRACLHLTQKRWKLPVLQIQASSMKLRAHAFLFLVFHRIKWVVKTNFYYNDFNIQIRRFLTELVESKSRGKYSPIIIRIGTNTAFLAFSLGV